MRAPGRSCRRRATRIARHRRNEKVHGVHGGQRLGLTAGHGRELLPCLAAIGAAAQLSGRIDAEQGLLREPGQKRPDRLGALVGRTAAVRAGDDALGGSRRRRPAEGGDPGAAARLLPTVRSHRGGRSFARLWTGRRAAAVGSGCGNGQGRPARCGVSGRWFHEVLDRLPMQVVGQHLFRRRRRPRRTEWRRGSGRHRRVGAVRRATRPPGLGRRRRWRRPARRASQAATASRGR